MAADPKDVLQIKLSYNETLDVVYDQVEKRFLLVIAERKSRVHRRTMAVLSEDEAKAIGRFLMRDHRRLKSVSDVKDEDETV